MAKNIVLLSDGTGNSAGKLFKTNVWRLYQTLDLTDETRQIAYYDDGVGTSSLKPWALLAGAFGIGLKRNVIDLYMFLCRNYRQGDRIYCFGFSRGAFTVRILTGLVNSQGLLPNGPEETLRVQATKAFNRYRNLRKHWLRRLRQVRWLLPGVKPSATKPAPPAHENAPPIAFLGVWDTVAAYGTPFGQLTTLLSYVLPLSVPDRDPCPIVEHGCHAVALDDERKTFHPVLWNEQGVKPGRIKQVWFAGAHADVGGGYAEDNLSYIPLDWMIDEAFKRGLIVDRFAWSRIRAAMNVNGMLHDSRKGIGAAYRYLPRDMARLCNDLADPDNQVVVKRPKIHESALRRIAHTDDGYAPIVLPASYAALGADGTLHDLPDAPGSAVPPYLWETCTTAAERYGSQRQLAGFIRSRTLLYWCSLLVVAFLALGPSFARWIPASMAEDSSLRQWLVKVLGVVVPDVLGFWLEFWAARLPELALLLGVLFVLQRLSSRIRTRMRDRMREIWMRIQPPRTEAMADHVEAPLATAGIRMAAGDTARAPSEPPPAPQGNRKAQGDLRT